LKGIVLAGGAGTRLYPNTLVLSKQLLPVYDKPMIYYPLSALLLAGITEVLIIGSERDVRLYRDLLGDGERWGVTFEFAVQEQPKGIAEALIIGRSFSAGERVALVLGDNIFYGDGLGQLLQKATKNEGGATIFGYWVRDPSAYGVVDIDEDGLPISIVEKPVAPKSSYAVTGLYFYDADAADIAESMTPSGRGELEITDVNRVYLEQGRLSLELLGRGYAWFDCGTHDNLLDAGDFVRTVEKRQGLKIACIEEIVYRKGLIDAAQMTKLAGDLSKSDYGAYLQDVVESRGPHGVGNLR